MNNASDCGRGVFSMIADQFGAMGSTVEGVQATVLRAESKLGLDETVPERSTEEEAVTNEEDNYDDESSMECPATDDTQDAPSSVGQEAYHKDWSSGLDDAPSEKICKDDLLVVNAEDDDSNSLDEDQSNREEQLSPDDKEMEEEDQPKKKRSGKGRGRRMTQVNFLPSDCKLCGEKFSSDKALGYHIRDVHVVGQRTVETEVESGLDKKERHRYIRHGKGNWRVTNPKRPYNCAACGHRFMYESSLVHHQIVKHEEKLGADAQENNSMCMPPKLYSHTFQCDQCGKILMSKQSLITHLVSFHGTDHEKPFQCDICGQRYVSISSLVSHRRREHTGDKPYVCEHCGKAFTMSNRLKCHLRVHSDEKVYKCQQCSKAFKSCSAFRAHKDTHEGVMRHTCKYCARKFLFQGNMIKHIRRRHSNGEQVPALNEDSAEDVPVKTPERSLRLSQESTDSGGPKTNEAVISKTPVSSVINVPTSRPTQAQSHVVSTANNVHPEIQFQVLPLVSGHDAFVDMHYQTSQQNHCGPRTAANYEVNSSAVVLFSDSPDDCIMPAGCRFCEQQFSDIRYHLLNYHRIPPLKIEMALKDFAYC